MRDPARISRIVALLSELWEKNPDWRLGQLIVNAMRFGGKPETCDAFYCEDNFTEAGLQELLLGDSSFSRWKDLFTRFS